MLSPPSTNRQPDAAELLSLLLQVAPPPAPAGAKSFTMAEVEQHTTMESAWFVVDGKVYDATPFLKDHPGEPLLFLLTLSVCPAK